MVRLRGAAAIRFLEADTRTLPAELKEQTEAAAPEEAEVVVKTEDSEGAAVGAAAGGKNSDAVSEQSKVEVLVFGRP